MTWLKRLLLVSIEIEILSLPNYSNEEPAGILVMREHSEALTQLFPYSFLIKRWKHSLFYAPFTHVFHRNIRKVGKLMKIVIFTRFLNFLSHYPPLGHPLSEFEPGQCHLFKLDAAGKLLQGTRNDRLILDGVEWTGGVRELASHFKQLKAFEKDARLEDMEGGTVLSGPFFPFLRDFTDCCVWAAGHITYDTVKEDSRIGVGGGVWGLVAESREVLSIMV